MSLRADLTRVAYANPHLRPVLLPLLVQSKKAYNPEEETEDPNKVIENQVREIIQLLRQGVKRSPRMRLMMLGNVAGRLLDTLEYDMMSGPPQNMGFGMRQLRYLRNRLRATLGDVKKG